MAPFAASLTAPPAVLAPSFAVSATVATGPLLDALDCGLPLRVVRFVELEPLRLALDFARPAGRFALPDFEPDFADELDDRFVFVCWAI